MAWTAPRTWTTGEVVTAAIMNTHVRDNLLFLHDDHRPVIVKTAQESVVSSIAIQDDDHLFFSIGANEVWIFDVALFLAIGSAAADIKLTISGPASPNSSAWGAHGGSTASTGTPSTMNYSVKPFGTEINYMVGDTDLTLIYLTGFIDNGANAGTVRLRWAQNVSNAIPTTILNGSWLNPRQIS